MALVTRLQLSAGLFLCLQNTPPLTHDHERFLIFKPTPLPLPLNMQIMSDRFHKHCMSTDPELHWMDTWTPIVSLSAEVETLMFNLLGCWSGCLHVTVMPMERVSASPSYRLKHAGSALSSSRATHFTCVSVHTLRPQVPGRHLAREHTSHFTPK